MDRPPFKVLGNRTLIEIAERRPKKLSELAEIKGITELLLRRLGRAVLDAVRDGRRDEHGPLPKLPPSGRRRMDRHADRRLLALKRWRAERAQELALDPGVLCPNSALEAIAWRAPSAASDLEGMPEIKGWFVREFGAEVVAIALEAPANNPPR
jgi:ribonuclease D